MLDLEHQAVTGWLTDIQPARTDADWPPPVRPIETAGDAPALLARLGIAMDGLSGTGADLAEKLESNDVTAVLRDLLAQLGAARMLRIVSALRDSTPPDRAAELVDRLTASDTSAGRALASAIAASARTTLRGRLISDERLAALVRATTPDLEETP